MVVLGARTKVFPAPGRKVQGSEIAVSDGGDFLPPEGREVTWSAYWQRRYRTGDVILHDPTTGSAAPPVTLDRAADLAAELAAAARKKRAAAERALEEADEADKSAVAAHELALEQGKKLVSKLSHPHTDAAAATSRKEK